MSVKMLSAPPKPLQQDEVKNQEEETLNKSEVVADKHINSSYASTITASPLRVFHQKEQMRHQFQSNRRDDRALQILKQKSI